ncbi:cadherin-like domain-containing protein [Tateyamaria sp. ANG-S1]|uniref:cadherin-like domain-containing protein n=1 Tax=Tateyamaria sp. ANG-S1 TaxID=1577905 RepID=UPI0006902420|nr:cadherin-like domain-containing protein [Tateyamaria sp. ANG-S1]
MTKFIDFNSLATGTVVDNEFSAEGVTISAVGGSNKAMIFNTAHPTGGDSDLRTTNLGKALIISEDGDSHDPDDNAGGGKINFTFDDPSSVNRLTFLDIEEGARVKFFDADGHLIKSVSIHDTDDNGQAIVDFDVDGVSRMEVELHGSGAIDNLVFDTTGDGVVEGDNDANLIDAGFTGDPEGDMIDAGDALLPGEGPDDDIVDALGGDDTIKSGDADDEVYAGSGDDSVLGGDGDDVIYGDSNYAGPGAGVSEREVFEWEKSPFGDGNDLGNFTQDTGNVTVSFKILSQSGASETIQSDDDQNVSNIDGDGNNIDDNSSLDNVLNGKGNSADYELSFSDPVEDVSFRINDIDGDGVVRVKAYNAAGQQIEVNLEGGSNLTLKDTDGVSGNDTADSNGGYLDDTSDEYSVLVSIPGPVARIVIEHDQDGNNNSGINITDVYFDAPIVDDGEAGNDVLQGGAGDDTIFGEDGDDTLKGENDDDTLVGGDGNDRLEGGKGNDLLDGGDDRDILLGGSGADTGFGGGGDDEIWMGSGDDVAEGGDGKDWIHGQTGDDTLDGGADDDMVFGEDGDDVLIGGGGDDLLKGGADADTIFGGSGDTVDGGAGGFNADPALNTDNDVLDLTGQGPFFLDNVTPDSNGNGINGTVVFVDGDGNPNGLTLAFTEIEEVIGDEINRGPDAVDDTAIVAEDGSVVINVLANDSDPDIGDVLSVTEATSPDGDVTINADGTLTFEPSENFNGDTTISYTISDGNGGEDTATVNVTVTPVNDAPDAINDTATTDEDTAVTIDALANDTDVDGDDLTITGASVPADQGTVEVVDNKLVYTPALNFNGDATISYAISDGNGGTDTAEVTVTVNPVNDDPVAVDDLADTMEDEAVVIDLLGNDTDVDGDTLILDAVSVPADQGSVVDNGDGTVTFTPAPNFNGTATIDYTVSDGNGGTDDGQAIISVGAVNDGPTAVDDTATTDEDTPVTIDVVANDTDPDGDALTITGASVPADQGTVEVVDNKLVYTPAENFNGDVTISYAITDGNGGTSAAEVAVTVTPVNDDPVAVDDIETTDEDVAVVVDLLGNDTDVDGDTLEIGSLSVDPAEGSVVDNGDGTVTFTPAPNFNGPATITYTVIDGNGGEDTGEAVVSVGAVNDGPVAVDDSETTEEDTPVTIDVLANDTDADGDDLTVISAVVPADQGTAEIVDNKVVFTPAENFNGDVTITYTISDGNGGTDVGEVSVTVTPVNDAPEANDDAETTPFNTAVDIPVLANDTDVDDDALRVTEATSPDGDVVINSDGTLTFTPNDGFEGDATIDYTITDDEGGFDSAQVTVTVEPNPLDGIVEGTDDGELIDEDYTGDPEGDMVDNGDNIFSDDPADADDDIIEAGGGNDTIIAGQGEDVVDGGDGDDLIETGNGDVMPDLGFPNDDGTPAPGFPFGFAADEDPENDRDSVDGGAGDDTISTGDDADTITGGTGDDVIDGGIDDDEIFGEDGFDRIVGGEGNDLIEGGIGDDTIYAGNDPDLGLDQLNIEDDGSNPIFPSDPRPDNGMDTVFGGDGNDLIFGADDDDELYGEDGNDTIDGEIDDDFIDGGIGDDSLLGGQGNDTIEGGEGNDFIDGGRNADTLNGGAGNDTILGDNGADVINGGEGDDLIDGGTGDDTLNGDGGNDSILGSTGDDVIDGGAGNDTIDGGNGGADIMSGGADRDLFVNVDAGEVVDGGSEGDDFDTLDLRGSVQGNGSLKVVFTNPDSDGNGFDGVVNYFDTNGDQVGQLTFTNIEDVIPCFTPGTLIATPGGERRVEDLKPGDRVITRDNGIQEIRWVGQRAMTGEELAKATHLRPVLIRQGALGKGLPERDMLVSPQHRVLVADKKTALYFDESEVLVAAKHLTGMDGIDVVDVSETTYIHVMFDQHEVILSDGAWTESFQPGDMTLNAMGDAQRAEILELFPELETVDGIANYASARRSLKKHEAKLLTQ